MDRKLVIHQPNFLPYLGFFEQLGKTDVYIAFDDVQFAENEFQNRNFIKCDKGRTALSLPVKKKGRFGQLIKDVEISDSDWFNTICNKLKDCYRKAPYFNECMEMLSEALCKDARFMVDVNLPLIHMVSDKLGLSFETFKSSSLNISFSDRVERIFKLMKGVDANTLIVGTGAATYLNRKTFLELGFDLEIHRFEPQQYHQSHGEFISHLSVIDYIMNVGWHLKRQKYE